MLMEIGIIYVEDHGVIKQMNILLGLERKCQMVIMFLVGFNCGEASEIHLSRTGFSYYGLVFGGTRWGDAQYKDSFTGNG